MIKEQCVGQGSTHDLGKGTKTKAQALALGTLCSDKKKLLRLSSFMTSQNASSYLWLSVKKIRMKNTSQGLQWFTWVRHPKFWALVPNIVTIMEGELITIQSASFGMVSGVAWAACGTVRTTSNFNKMVEGKAKWQRDC